MESIKIEDIPWCRMITAYDTAENYPELLNTLNEMKDIDEVKQAWNEISSFENQNTLFTPAPFVLVFLVRIYEKAVNSPENPVAAWLADRLERSFEYYAEVCDDMEKIEHPKALENMSDILNENYLIPEGDDLSDYDEDEFQELIQKILQENLFYSLYYYSGVVLAEIPDPEETETYREFFHLEEYSEDIIKKVISSAMKGSPIPITDTAKKLNISENDIRKILSATSQVWNH